MSCMPRTLLVAGGLLVATLGGAWGAAPSAAVEPAGNPPDPATIPTEAHLKVAFIGDGGSGPGAEAVLRLIRSEGADLVIHSGDFDYGNDPGRWDSLITSILGADFPYFASIGDGDVAAWPGYQKKLLERLARVKGATSVGDLGVRSACSCRGLFVILSGVGTMGTGHEAFIRDQLAGDRHIWKVCSWHQTQNAMQVGDKPDAVGWGAYEAAIQGGAIIATAHEHSYARTRTLVSAQRQSVDPACPGADTVCVGPGRSFVFQSGLGGRSIRSQKRCLPDTYPYGCNGEWADIYTRAQKAQFGALFIVFNVDGDPNRARGYFKTIEGATVDSFVIVHSAPVTAGR